MIYLIVGALAYVALVAAAHRLSRGGRPDLVDEIVEDELGCKDVPDCPPDERTSGTGHGA